MRQQAKYGARGAVPNGSPQYIDIQKLDLNQIRALKDVILQAKELPLTQLNLPNKGGKQYEILEVSVQSLPQTHSTGSRNMNRYNRNRSRQRSNKGSYGRIPQNLAPASLPLQFQYVTVPKVKSLVPQILPKGISVTPVKIPHPVPTVDDILGLKNVQVVEVPVPAVPPAGKSSRTSHYGKRNAGYGQPQYRMPTPKSQPTSFPANTYYAHQAEQPRQHFPAPQSAKSSYSQQQQQPMIEAELVKLSEEEIQSLLKNLQVVKQNSQDFLKFLPIAESAHKSKPDQVHLILALPEGNNDQAQGYGSRSSGRGEQGSSYGKEQYVSVPQKLSYATHSATSISHNSGGYQIENQNQAVEHNAAGYQIEGHSGNSYDQNSYQNTESKSSYGHNAAYQDIGLSNEYAPDGHQGYTQAGYGAPVQQQEVQDHREEYIELISPQSGENGYTREPVLAVEIHKGQSIEDAIKAIDPETLQRLGAHGKDGLEIELVEVPVDDEYSAESKKSVTYVPSSNITTKAPAKKSTTTAASKVKSTTTEKKS